MSPFFLFYSLLYTLSLNNTLFSGTAAFRLYETSTLILVPMDKKKLRQITLFYTIALECESLINENVFSIENEIIFTVSVFKTPQF